MGTGHACQALDGWKQPEGFDSPILRTTVQLVFENGTLGSLTRIPSRRNLSLLGKRALSLGTESIRPRISGPFLCFEMSLPQR